MTSIATRAGHELSIEDDFDVIKAKIAEPASHVEVRLVGGGSALLHINDLAVVVADD